MSVVCMSISSSTFKTARIAESIPDCSLFHLLLDENVELLPCDVLLSLSSDRLDGLLDVVLG